MKQIKVNDNLEIHYGGGKKEYYKVISMDDFIYVDTHSATAAQTTGTFSEITNLNPPNDQLYVIYGIGVDGNMKFYFKQPAAINRWGVERAPESTFFTDRISPKHAPFPIEMVIMENYPPHVKDENFTNDSITPSLCSLTKGYPL